MRRLIQGLVVLIVLGLIGFGVHAGLVAASQGTGAMAENAADTCSFCHGG